MIYQVCKLLILIVCSGMCAGCFTRSYMVVDLAAGHSADVYPVRFRSSVPAGGWTDEYKTTKLVLRCIPRGTFIMGAPSNYVGYVRSEVPTKVTISKAFYCGVFEVTQKQWECVMGTWPSYFTNASDRDSRPVEQVSYNLIRGVGNDVSWPATKSVGSDSFMGRLRKRTGRIFDLPTEAQWEYAGRALTTTPLNSGEKLTPPHNCANLSAVGRYWFNGGSNYSQNVDASMGSAIVGSYLPNAWGLYDVHGNVWEWCLDWYSDVPGSGRDPVGAPAGLNRALRGGGWKERSSICLISTRAWDTPKRAYFSMGFRATCP